MRLLVITQKVDKKDKVLGFFHRWLEEMASSFDFIEVIALGVGDCNLPQNIKVHSLGKEGKISRINKVINFYKLLFSLKDRYDAVFVHMNPEYVVLAGWLWKVWQKPVYLWYLHKSVTWKLRYAQKKVKKIFTANKESCRLVNRDNIVIVGHGIDTDFFIRMDSHMDKKVFNILSIGRMSRSKNFGIAIDALALIKEDFKFTLIAPIIDKAGELYKEELINKINQLGIANKVELSEGVLYEDLPKDYSRADLFIHTSETGSVDKVVLEAMACEVPVLTSSEAFDFLPDEYHFKKGDTEWLAKKIEAFMHEKDKNVYKLRKIVEEKFSLQKLIKRLKSEIDPTAKM